jgi:rhodanese-related sulfurtransferase
MPSNTMVKPLPKMNEQECAAAATYFKTKLDCEMTPWTLKGMMDEKAMKDLCVLDVRAAQLYAACRLPDAINVPLRDLAGNMAALPKDKTIVAYCADMSCAMATQACLELAQKGYKVMELRGGISTWLEKGFPVVMKA